MDDYLRCNKCIKSDHEGPNLQFCLCEMRNIRIAKEMRNRNETPWVDHSKNKDEICQLTQ